MSILSVNDSCIAILGHIAIVGHEYSFIYFRTIFYMALIDHNLFYLKKKKKKAHKIYCSA